MKTLVLVAMSVVLVLSINAHAANVFIDPTCENNGDGSVGSPCAASGGAAGPRNTWVGVTWTAGNTYLGKGGTSQTLSSFQVAGSGSAGNPITISSYGTGKFTFRATASYATAIVSRTYITWDGVTFESTSTNCLYLTGVSNNIIIKNSTFSTCGAAATGIALEGQSATANFDSIQIDRNDFSNIGGPAVRVQMLNSNNLQHDDWSITNNTMVNVDSGGNSGAIFFLMDSGSTAQIRNLTISGNLIENVNDEESNPAHLIRLVRGGVLSAQEDRYIGVWIENNTIINSGGGVSLAHIGTSGATRMNRVSGNTLRNLTATAGIISFWSKGLWVTGNTIDQINTFSAVSFIDGSGIDMDLGNTDAHVMSNVVTNCLGHSSKPANSGQGIMNFGSSTSEFVGNVMRGNRIGFFFGDESAGIAGVQSLRNNTITQSSSDGVHIVLTVANVHVIANNIIYANGGYGINALTANDGSLDKNIFFSNTLGNYNSQTPGVTDLTVDPLLVSTTDFRLQLNSPARRAGGFYPTCRDVRGRPCWMPPDIGAYQMTSGDVAVSRSSATTRSAATSRSVATSRLSRS